MDKKESFPDRPGYSFNNGPPPEASAYFSGKTNRPGFSWRDVEPEEHAAAFTVAKAMKLEVLEDIRGALQKALDEGIPFAQFQKELQPRLEKLGWWGKKEVTDPKTGEVITAQLGSPRRLKTIYNANIRSARAAGQWQRIERTKRALPYLLYQLGPSERHRPEHAAKAGLVLPVDDPFWASWMPPNGWGCKCRVRQITAREAGERGIDEAPVIEVEAKENERTGEIWQVPKGIDPGWHTNPGQKRLDYLNQHLNGTLSKADPAIARAAARDMAGSWRARRIVDQSASGSVPIAMLDDVLQTALKSKSNVVQYSRDTVDAHKHHPEVQPDALPLIGDLINSGLVILQRGEVGALQVFGQDASSKWWKLVVAPTKTGQAVFVKTWHRVSLADVTKARANGKVIRE